MNDFTRLPDPLGHLAVGIAHRSVIYPGIDGMTRELSLLIYYPADSNEGKTPYPYAFPAALREEEGKGPLQKTITHCYEGVAVSTQEPDYPVVIFNAGFGCYEMINTVLCSDLASSGFVVAVIGHPGDATAIKYTDGRVVTMYPEVLAAVSSPELMSTLLPMLDEFDNIPDDDHVGAIELGRRFIGVQDFFNSRMDLWVADTVAVADYLEEMNRETGTVLAGRLRLSIGIGLSGHSYGGSTAVHACHEDARFACGINVDGGNFGRHYGRSPGKPFLTLGNPKIWKMLKAYFLSNTCDSYHVDVRDGGHMGFTDFIFMRPQRDTERLGTREVHDYRELITKYHLAFFRKYLTRDTDMFGDLGYGNTLFYSKPGLEAQRRAGENHDD